MFKSRSSITTLAITSCLFVMWLVLASNASAELRTGSGNNVWFSDTGPGDSVNPVVQKTTTRYDSAGSLEVTITFGAPVVSPDISSAPHGAWLEFRVGDAYGSDLGKYCEGSDEGMYWTEFSLEELGPTVPLFDRSSISFAGTKLVITKIGDVALTWAPDRSSLTLAFSGAPMVGKNFICAQADLRLSNENSSYIDAFLFDGYSFEDGNLRYLLESIFDNQFRWLDNNDLWGRGVYKSRVRCSNSVLARCKVSANLDTGKRRSHISGYGSMYLSEFHGKIKYDPSMKMKLSFKHCPKQLSKRRAGKRCSKRLRWERGNIFDLVPSYGPKPFES